MSTQTVCDGCGAVLEGSQLAITGSRANNMGGGGLPYGDFDWCLDCSRTAFRAVKERQEAGQARGTGA